MTDGRSEPATPRGRAVAVVVAIVALAGVGGFAVGGSSATQAGGSDDWSPDPGKEGTPDDSADDETETTTETGTETTTEVDCPPVDDSDDDDDNDEGYQLNVSYAGDWSGRILTNESSTPIEGSGSELIDLNVEDDEDEHVGVSVTKTDLNSDTLSIQLLYDGEVVDEQNRIRPDVTNFDSDADTSSFDSTSDTSSFDETTTDDWAAFGEDEESDAFGDDVFAQQEGDPFDGNDTITEECEPVEENDEDDTTTETTDDDSDFSIETDEEAQIVFGDQEVPEGETQLTVESATLPDGGFVVIHNASLSMDNVEGSMIGVSEKLDAEQSKDITVDITLPDGIEDTQDLVAIAYRDTNDDGKFEYDSKDSSNEFYFDDNGSVVADEAMMTVPNDDDEDTPTDSGAEASGAEVFGDEEPTTTDASAQSAEVFTDTDTSTATVTRTETTESDSTLNAQEGTSAPETPNTDMSGNAVEESTETNAPGFGVGVAIVATLGTALLVTRRQD